MRRRDENVWTVNWCFTHGEPTVFTRTCPSFAIHSAGNPCDVAPATVTRDEPVPRGMFEAVSP